MVSLTGLATICRGRCSQLTELDISTQHLTAGLNSFGDEAAVIVAREVLQLRILHAWKVEIGKEGVEVIADNLAALSTMSVGGSEILSSCSAYGRLANMNTLHISSALLR